VRGSLRSEAGKGDLRKETDGKREIIAQESTQDIPRSKGWWHDPILWEYDGTFTMEDLR
jgi:hypothetical protein